MRHNLVENRPSEPILLSQSDLNYLQGFKFSKSIGITPAGNHGYVLTADNVAGALALPSGLQIHIRPKMGLPNLFRLLSFVASDDFGMDEMVDYEEEDGIFDLLGQLYARELLRILKSGLRLDYRETEGNLSTIRGRILFGPHIRANIAGQAKAYCSFSQRSSNTIENRTLLAATQSLLRSRVCRQKTQDVLRVCLHQIPSEVDTTGFSAQQISKLQLGSHNQYYRRALFLAKLVLRSIAFSNNAGQSNQPSFLIDVAKLFEDYVAQALLQFLNDQSLEVVPHETSQFDVDGTLTIQPDLIFRSKTTRGVVSVADTKYKDLDAKSVSSQDAYQMLAYMVKKGCSVSVLIYPESTLTSAASHETKTIRSGETDYKIHAVTVPLSDPKETASAIGRLLGQLALAEVRTARRDKPSMKP